MSVNIVPAETYNVLYVSGSSTLSFNFQRFFINFSIFQPKLGVFIASNIRHCNTRIQIIVCKVFLLGCQYKQNRSKSSGKTTFTQNYKSFFDTSCRWFYRELKLQNYRALVIIEHWSGESIQMLVIIWWLKSWIVTLCNLKNLENPKNFFSVFKFGSFSLLYNIVEILILMCETQVSCLFFSENNMLLAVLFNSNSYL